MIDLNYFKLIYRIITSLQREKNARMGKKRRRDQEREQLSERASEASRQVDSDAIPSDEEEDSHTIHMSGQLNNS